MSGVDDFFAGLRDRHAAEVAEGKHDDACEWRANGHYLCHCSKRRREAAGFSEPPTEELYFPPPACPRCDQDLDHDGDSWRCYTCQLAWDNDGSHAHYTDDYGDDLAAGAAHYDARAAAELHETKRSSPDPGSERVRLLGDLQEYGYPTAPDSGEGDR